MITPTLFSALACLAIGWQVRRTKEMLSANTNAPITCEEFHKGVDFQVRGPLCRRHAHTHTHTHTHTSSSSSVHITSYFSIPLPLSFLSSSPQSTISRSELEGLMAAFFARASAPLERLINRSGLKVADINAVELLGGGSRVPGVQVRCGRVGRRALSPWPQPCRHLLRSNAPFFFLVLSPLSLPVGCSEQGSRRPTPGQTPGL